MWPQEWLYVVACCLLSNGVSSQTVCERLTTDTGSFTSPNYPDNYPDEHDCRYKISVTPSKVIRLTFTEFDVEKGYDYVYVYDGKTTDSILKMVFSECEVGQYRCANGVTCIDAWRRCDGNNDCRDRSDEDPSSCECKDIPSSLSMCRGLDYRQITLPNPLNYNLITLDEVKDSEVFGALSELADSECHPRVKDFVCATMVPRCESSPNLRQLLPCQSWCAEVKFSCFDEWSWSSIPGCEFFPDTNCNNVNTSTTPLDGKMCFDGNGANYRGVESRGSVTRVDCEPWDSDPNFQESYPWANLVDNKCRNPTGDERPWCFTRNGFEYCDVIPCGVLGCKDPGKPRFGKRRPILKFYWPGDRIKYTCDTGFKFKDGSPPNEALCLIKDNTTGEADWNTQKPNCEVDQKVKLQNDLRDSYDNLVSPLTNKLTFKAYVVNIINLDNMTCAVCWRAGEEYSIDCSNSTSHKDENFLTCYDLEDDIVTGEWSGTTTLSAKNNTACLTMTLQRDPTYHYATTISPCLILIILMIITFIMPIDKGDRIGFGVTVLLSMVVSLVVVTGFLPVSSTLPFIAMLIIVCMALMALFMLTTLFIIIIHDKKGPVPKWVRTIFLKHLARALLMGDLTKKAKTEEPTTKSSSNKGKDIEGNIKPSFMMNGDDQSSGSRNPPLSVKNECVDTDIGLKASVDELKVSVKHLSGSIDALARGNGDDGDEEVGEYALLANVLDRLSLVLYLIAIAATVPCTLLFGRPRFN
uniref:Uncharacterized protein n=1 Tax=Branchiostoma floridae TaxID=7739 RepID=C3YCR5_BRAFL|eukprot:XP_002605856.1 hypothetical protein BRAFLDRAFT_126037 [Branchiostoma floridae]